MDKKKKKYKGVKGVKGVNATVIRKSIMRAFPVLMLPAFAAFLIGFVWPFVQGIYLSFCNFTTTSNATFVGIQNYFDVFKDASFRNAFSYTIAYAITSLILINVIAFAIAYVLTMGIKGTNIFRTVFFMPNLIGGIVLGYIWQMIFNGILSHFNTSILLESKYGFWGLIILMCWQQIGYMMIIYIAGFQSVSEDIKEAAKIDGATGWKTLIYVTIPNMMSSITVCTFLTLTNGFKLFDQNLALTGGAPIEWVGSESINTTEMLALNIYNTFYGQAAAAKGIGQAKAVVFFVLVAILSLIQLTLTRSKEVQA